MLPDFTNPIEHSLSWEGIAQAVPQERQSFAICPASGFGYCIQLLIITLGFQTEGNRAVRHNNK